MEEITNRSSRFHLAIPVGDITTAIDFYCNKLGVQSIIVNLTIQMLG